MPMADRQLARRAARRAQRRAALAGEGQGSGSIASPTLPNASVLFRDIEVVPGDSYRLRSILTNGGPVWPDFQVQTLARFMHNGRFVDAPIDPSLGPLERIDRPCVWGGYAIHHFGHLIADHLTRVLESRVNRPEDLFLFVLRPGHVAADTPDYFWQILEWYGVSRAMVQFVTSPVMVSQLRCFAQAEPLGSNPPSEHYLSLLADNAQSQRLQAEFTELAYVGRMGLLGQGKGGAAGEGYLAEMLARKGVRVLDPSQASLRDQLSVYAGAKVLIFSEGSAIHGRQLLGRLDQTIVIFNRRTGARIAQTAITARCADLRYVEACGRVINIGTFGVRKHKALTMSLYDLDAVFATFGGFGIDLASDWDQAAYAAAVCQDAERWLLGQAEIMGAVVFDLEEAYHDLHAAGVPVRRPYDI